MSHVTTILAVDDEQDALSFVQRALRDKYTVLTASTAQEAIAILQAEKVDVVLTDHRMPHTTGTQLLHHCHRHHPSIRRVLVTAFSDLPDVIKARASRVAERVLAKPAKAVQIQQCVAALLGKGAQPVDEPTRKLSVTSPLYKLSQRLLSTIKRVTKIEGATIRPLSQRELAHLEVVVPMGDDFESFREWLVGAWGTPLKQRGQPTPRKARKHPIVKRAQGFTREQEVYCQEDENEDAAFVLTLPWRRDPSVTVVLGVHLGPNAQSEEHAISQFLADLHDYALEEIAEFVLPADLGTATLRKGEYLPHFDWVATANYVGPERRGAPTSFANTFVLRGKRSWVPKHLRESTIAFADRISPWVWKVIVAYVLLSAMDTVLTYVYVAGGTFRELNPVWRDILDTRPWLFVVGKNAMVVASIFVVARFEWWRPGRFVLWLCLLGYVALDVYWVALLVRLWLHAR